MSLVIERFPEGSRSASPTSSLESEKQGGVKQIYINANRKSIGLMALAAIVTVVAAAFFVTAIFCPPLLAFLGMTILAAKIISISSGGSAVISVIALIALKKLAGKNQDGKEGIANSQPFSENSALLALSKRNDSDVESTGSSSGSSCALINNDSASSSSGGIAAADVQEAIKDFSCEEIDWGEKVGQRTLKAVTDLMKDIEKDHERGFLNDIDINIVRDVLEKELNPDTKKNIFFASQQAFGCSVREHVDEFLRNKFGCGYLLMQDDTREGVAGGSVVNFVPPSPELVASTDSSPITKLSDEFGTGSPKAPARNTSVWDSKNRESTFNGAFKYVNFNDPEEVIEKKLA